ncbi:hypothetical protein [Roseateles noduli]|uniref:hypothetical protein n=1 Tax=Roseateles noduli TaxID=2052484 RepID=UPI003D64CDC1
MKAHVDLSIFSTPNTSFGMASGELEFAVLPSRGEIVSLAGPTGGQPLPLLQRMGNFSLQLKVDDVVHAPGAPSPHVMLLLEPAVMAGDDQAEALGLYLEHAFGMFFDRFGE